MSAFLPSDPKLETAIKAKGEQLFALMDQQPPPALFSKKGAYARLMDWSMKDPAFKTQLFRFVDVLPTLGSASSRKACAPATLLTRTNATVPPMNQTARMSVAERRSRGHRGAAENGLANAGREQVV